MSSVFPENAYDEPPPEPPAIIIVASMTSTGDSAPMRSCERSYMEPKNLGVCCAVMPAYFRVVSYYTCIIRATSLRLSEQVVCPDTLPPRSPALAAPPQRARWLCCAVGATATPHLCGEDVNAT